jgi:SAM-dependent methyltransferase
MDEIVDKRSAPPARSEAGAACANEFGCEWRTDNFATEQYRSSFTDVPNILEDWMSDLGGLDRKTILDFGCGECVTGLAIALKYPASSVVGLEVVSRINDTYAFAHREIGLNKIPPNLRLCQVRPGEEAVPGLKYDLIYSWSVFEHIDQVLLPDIINQIYESLKPTGRFLVQIAPLYFSSEGSHLLPWTQERWSHLSLQDETHLERLRSAVDSPAMFDGLYKMYTTLNKVTFQQLGRLLTAAGFEIEREYFSHESFDIPQELLDIYKEEALRTNCVVYLCKRK